MDGVRWKLEPPSTSGRTGKRPLPADLIVAGRSVGRNRQREAPLAGGLPDPHLFKPPSPATRLSSLLQVVMLIAHHCNGAEKKMSNELV